MAINQLLEEQQWKKDNGPIDVTIDQLWKYSGEVEEDNITLKLYNAHHDKAYDRQKYKI